MGNVVIRVSIIYIQPICMNKSITTLLLLWFFKIISIITGFTFTYQKFVGLPGEWKEKDHGKKSKLLYFVF